MIGINATFPIPHEYLCIDQVLNVFQVAVAATHSLSDALKLTLSTQFNLATNDAHKFGLGIEFEPK